MSHAWTLHRFAVCTYTSNTCPPGSEKGLHRRGTDAISEDPVRFQQELKKEELYLYVFGTSFALHAPAAPLGMYLGRHPNACHVYIEDPNLTFLAWNRLYPSRQQNSNPYHKSQRINIQCHPPCWRRSTMHCGRRRAVLR